MDLSQQHLDSNRSTENPKSHSSEQGLPDVSSASSAPAADSVKKKSFTLRRSPTKASIDAPPASVAEYIARKSSGTSPIDGVRSSSSTAAPAAPLLSVVGGHQAGKTGKGGTPADTHSEVADCSNVTNAEFAAAPFRSVPEGASPAICSKPGDPEEGGWPAMRPDSLVTSCPASNNNYINCASFKAEADGRIQARKSHAVAVHFLLLDDIGTKVPFDRLGAFKLSWLIETSFCNYQAGIILDPPVSVEEAEVLLAAIMRAGLCDPGASGAATRWARLPAGINGKEKYRCADGSPFQCQLVEWAPETRYSPQEVMAGLKLEPAAVAARSVPVQAKASSKRARPERADSVYTPKAAENPVVAALKECGLYKAETAPGKHDITCPWVKEHTDQLDNGAAYFEPDDRYASGGFCCHHSHRDQYHLRELINFLGISDAEARHKPVIRVVAGDMPRVVAAAERELAKLDKFYRSGGLIVTVATDPLTGDPAIVPISKEMLTTELAQAIRWEAFDRRAKEAFPCDPPIRHVGLIFDGQNSRYLPPLAGLARQPYFKVGCGDLVVNSGYDPESQRFGAFDPGRFVLGETTAEAARAALAMLEELLSEFHFVAPHDKAAALAAIFTAVLRPSLACAPAFHVQAPVFASGKTFLCDLIGCFAGPGGNFKVSYPKTSEEATKTILSLLLGGPAVIEFDDMDTDWIPHGVIKRMLTAEHITDRILGVSKTATVSTRTLFLGSGNNVGPVRDLLRRVLTIQLNPRCATPATLSYRGNPVENVRANRGKYVAAVLTIIQAWRAAGSPRAEVSSIASYGGDWSDYCRHALIWLDRPDPATALLTQIRHDPDSDVLGALMEAWWAVFGSTPTTVREATLFAYTKCSTDNPLLEAMEDCPATERDGRVNNSKFGWFLKRNVNRTCHGYAFQEARADGRLAWRLMPVGEGPETPAAARDSAAGGSGDATPGEDGIAF